MAGVTPAFPNSRFKNMRNGVLSSTEIGRVGVPKVAVQRKRDTRRTMPLKPVLKI